MTFPKSVMSIALPRSTLLDALQRIALATPTKTTLPILTSVKIVRDDRGLTLTATDIDRTLVTTIPIDDPSMLGGVQKVAVALPSRRLLDIISQLPPALVTIEISGAGVATKARVSAGRSKFEIFGFPVDEFPIQRPMEPIASVEIDGKAFTRSLARVATHASTEQSRPILNGICLSGSDDGLVLVGADGHHMVRELLRPIPGALVGQRIIPRQSVSALTKLFGETERLTIAVESQRVTFSGSGSTLELRLIEGPYPIEQVNRYFAEPQFYKAELDRVAFVAAIKRVSALTDVPKVGLTWTPTELILSAEGEGAGTAEDVVACTFEPISESSEALPSLRMDFNPALLLESLSTIQGAQVALQLSDPDKLALLFDPAIVDGVTMCLCVPLRSPLSRAASRANNAAQTAEVQHA